MDVSEACGGGALARSLRTRHVTMIAIGGIIGAGLFVGSSAAIAAAGPAIIVSYGLAGVVILLVMRMLCEMATARPDVASFTEFPRAALGDWAGFVTGWLYWYFWVVVIAIEAIAGAGLVGLWLPLPGWQIGLGLMALLTGVNLLSTRSYGEFEFWFASIKVAAIIAFIVAAAGFLLGAGGTGPGLANLSAHGGFAPHGPVAVLAAVTTVIFALCGAEIVTIAAVESREPARTLSRLTTGIVVRILLFYVLSIALIVAIVPWPEIRPGSSPFAAALDRIGIPYAATAMNLIVLTAVLSCLNSGVYVTSRVLFTLAGNGDAPAGLVALNGRRVPARAILASSAFGFLAVIASVISQEGVFAFLVNASGALMLMIYLLTALAQVRLRPRLERENPERLVLRMWFFPWASYGVIAAMVAVLLAMALTPALASQFQASVACLGVVVAGWFWRRRA